VAINRGGAQLTRMFQTGLPAGFYCDVTRYDTDGSACYLPGTATPAPSADLVVVDAAGQIVDQSVAVLSALAIHVDARVDVSAGDGAGSYGAAWHLPGGPRLGVQATYAPTWVTDNSDAGDDGVVQSGTWTVAGGGAVEVTVTGSDGYVSGWIDWDGSGAYGDAAGEEVFTNELVEAGQSRTLSFGIPAGTSLSQSLSARFRVYDSPQTRAAPAPTGGAGSGEVEDYVWSSTPTAVTAGSVGVGTGRSPAPLLALLLLALLSVGIVARWRLRPTG
jgi:hypothetical protein